MLLWLLLVAAAVATQQLNCMECLECAKQASNLVGCLERCESLRLPVASCRAACGGLAGPGATCASLGLCPRSRAEAHEHERRVFNVHGKGEPGVVV
jgi:hypothetical protein